jgi:hypothetical protein
MFILFRNSYSLIVSSHLKNLTSAYPPTLLLFHHTPLPCPLFWAYIHTKLRFTASFISHVSFGLVTCVLSTLRLLSEYVCENFATTFYSCSHSRSFHKFLANLHSLHYPKQSRRGEASLLPEAEAPAGAPNSPQSSNNIHHVIDESHWINPYVYILSYALCNICEFIEICQTIFILIL